MSARSCQKALRLARQSGFRAAPRLQRFASTFHNDQVHIIEVGPRDGLQNEKAVIPLETKTALVDRLSETGLRVIEAGSFVSPKWVPQMANSSEMLTHVLGKPAQTTPPINYHFLVPNLKGLEKLVEASESTSSSPTDWTKNTTISIFTAATETFSQKNTNCSIAESLERFAPVLERAKELELPVRAYVSVALGCPYEGPHVDPRRVADLTVSLLELGAEQISIGDTTGMGTARSTEALLKALSAAGVEMQDVALHLHDTYGQALVNTMVGLDAGVRTFDAAVGGLGGCPYSPGATGNVSSEELVYLMESLGLSTGVDLGKLSETGQWISGELGRENSSRVGKAVMSRRNQ